MSQLYRVTINERIETNGLGFWLDEGRPFTVEGTPMVRMRNVLVPAEGWHASRHEAVNAAASRIEAMGHRLLDQAAKLRDEAATEAAKERVVTT